MEVKKDQYHCPQCGFVGLLEKTYYFDDLKCGHCNFYIHDSDVIKRIKPLYKKEFNGKTGYWLSKESFTSDPTMRATAQHWDPIYKTNIQNKKAA